MAGMVAPSQFTLTSLFKDVAVLALVLAVLRFSLLPNDDAFVLPAIGMAIGAITGLALRRIGEGAFLG